MAPKKTYARTDTFQNGRDTAGTFILFFSVSAMVHLIFFTALFFAPDIAPKRNFSIAAINVNLVTLADPGTFKKSIDNNTFQTPEQSVTQKAYNKPAKTVSLAPARKKVKKSLKKKTFKSDKVVKNAISEIKKKVDESRPKPISDALEKLRRKVDQGDPVRRLKDKQTNQLTGPITGVQGKSGAKGGKAPEIMQIYNAEIAWQIEKNWVFSEDFAGKSTDLEAALAIKILPNGEIKEIWFDKKSGNSFLDDSVYKAVMKSNPLPPLPKGFLLPYYTVGLKFGPKGIK
ncbi:MAG: TonB C-terminal domain-containing protein [Deltaproteobacteria bacterium]|nr:TonB C-terminal domain-containing protein [Deltaproteobacteria bacterium]